MNVRVILFVVALAIVAGRIATATSSDQKTSFLSANDRSRWATVISLVEDGTYQIDRLVAYRDPIHRNRRPFDSIDKVRHLGHDGKQHFYSSKPPLLATMVAGIYAILHAITGMTITGYPAYLPRIILAMVNLPALAILFWCTDRAARRGLGWPASSHTDGSHPDNHSFASFFLIAAIAFGTMLTPMAISLNNHLIAAAATAVAMMMLVRTSEQPLGHLKYMIAGFAAAMAAANELPALSMLVGWGVLFAWFDRRSVPGFVLGAAIVAVGFFGTNYLAHGSLRMPYAHRGNGSLVGVAGSFDEAELNASVTSGKLPPSWQATLPDLLGSKASVNDENSANLRIEPSDEQDRFRLLRGEAQYAIVKSPHGKAEIRQWDDWYEFAGSYWQDGNRRGVDLGEPSRMRYFFHMMIGHYGVFSITPIWMLVPLGWWIVGRSTSWPTLIRQRWDHARSAGAMSAERTDSAKHSHHAFVTGWLVLATIAVTLVCVVFFVRRPLIDRNYGGVSVCFRWLLWLTPLWFYSLAASLRRVSHSSTGRWIALGLLAASVFSASLALNNPWQLPWIRQYLGFLNGNGAF